MTVKNNTDRALWIGSSKTAFITTEIKVDSSSSSISCTGEMYYYYSNARGSKGIKFYNGKVAVEQ